MKLDTKTMLVGLITATVLISSACHTLEGAGKDLESVGDKAEEVTRN